MKKLIIIIIAIVFLSCSNNSKCFDRNGKPYKYIINSEQIPIDGWAKTTEEITFLQNGSIKYYDEWRGWCVLSEYSIREYRCDN